MPQLAQLESGLICVFGIDPQTNFYSIESNENLFEIIKVVEVLELLGDVSGIFGLSSVESEGHGGHRVEVGQELAPDDRVFASVRQNLICTPDGKKCLLASGPSCPRFDSRRTQ